jgi:hypothetical protein
MLAQCAQTVELDAMQLSQGEAASTRVPMDDGNYSRKDKSLGLLCDKFLQEYSMADEVASRLTPSPQTLAARRHHPPASAHHACCFPYSCIDALAILAGKWRRKAI